MAVGESLDEGETTVDQSVDRWISGSASECNMCIQSRGTTSVALKVSKSYVYSNSVGSCQSIIKFLWIAVHIPQTTTFHRIYLPIPSQLIYPRPPSGQILHLVIPRPLPGPLLSNEQTK